MHFYFFDMHLVHFQYESVVVFKERDVNILQINEILYQNLNFQLVLEIKMMYNNNSFIIKIKLKKRGKRA